MIESYLDNSATTRVSPAAAEAVMKVMTENYGNPSSLHSKGYEAQTALENAREAIAGRLGAAKSEIYFTSGGTESNNLAITGAAEASRRLGNKIVTTEIEHPSVYDAVKHLESCGFETVFLKPDTYGRISQEQLEENIDESTILVSIMMVNNELGSVLPVGEVSRIIKRKKAPALLHCDAVQAFGKLPVNVKRLGVDLLTVSSHKIHGPKGAGALFIKKGVRIVPRTYGGLQESSIRCGTEGLPAIAGFGAAAGEMEFDGTAASLNMYLRQRLATLDGVHINSGEDATEYILNISVPGIRSETMLHYLASRGVYVSSGSACSKGKKSRVLGACGIDESLIDSALRISFSKYNTKDDIDRLLDGISGAMDSLVRRKHR